jgi:hypothetical protein
MKRNNKSRFLNAGWYEQYTEEDTRYYGVFIFGGKEDRHIQIDPKRYEKKIGTLPPKIKEVIAKQKGPYFHPAKRKHLDYNVNFIKDRLRQVKSKWDHDNKPMIESVLSKIQGVTFNKSLVNDDLFMGGIVTAEEAYINADMNTRLSHDFAEIKKKELRESLYAEFFHQMVAQIEACTLAVMTRNGYTGDNFDRNDFYSRQGNDREESIKTVAGFREYDKMYSIWHFIKHNSLSTYEMLKEKFPETLKKSEFKHGELACHYVDITDELINTILDGVLLFFIGYCRIIYDEDEYEASWNSDEHFESVIWHEIEAYTNPMGLYWWM